ncbi:unnamed protein product, partial [Phaedon cochleariae]
GLLRELNCYQFYLGDCPIYFEEPCHPGVIKFILSIGKGDRIAYYDIDPIEPRLPREFNVLVPLKIVVHGYGGLTVDSASANVTKAYQDIGYNVIIVDWKPLASIPCYVTAYFNTWHVGQCLASLTANLVASGIGPYFVHVVGFSLGAHVAGFAGKNLKDVLGYSFMRITGLDPALPFFATLKNDWKLDASDASFVDVIHTSAGSFGKLEATGHVDFYVNGGSLQPFCHKAPYPPLCSHIMAGIYFAESIRNRMNPFIGVKCDNFAYYYFGSCNSADTTVMGEYVPYIARGSYYVITTNESTFGLDNIYPNNLYT